MAFGYSSSILNFGQEKESSTSDFAGVPVGSRYQSIDGLRTFRYAFSQGAIGAGQVAMESAGTANHDMDLAIAAAAAIGDGSITVTLGGTLASLDQYKDGYIYINDGAGEGHTYHIQGHAAAAASGSLAVRLGDDTVREALTTAASLAGLYKNPYMHVELYDGSDIDGIVAGVAPAEIADNSYFWCQTWGPAAVLSGGVVPVIGKTVQTDIVGTPVDGAIEHTILIEGTPNTGNDQVALGVATLIAPVDTDYGMIFLTINP